MIKKYIKGENPLIEYAEGLHSTDTIEFSEGINLIVGSNGCGKTTLFKTIATILQCVDTAYAHINKGFDASFYDLFKSSLLTTNTDLKFSDRLEIVKGSRFSYLNVLNRKVKSDMEGMYDPNMLVEKMDNSIKSDGEKQFVCFNSIGECSGYRETINEVVVEELEDPTNSDRHKQHLKAYQGLLKSMEISGEPNDVFLIDDVTSEMAITKKIKLWGYMYELSKQGVQFIVNTHDLTPFLLEAKGEIKFNLIELGEYGLKDLESLTGYRRKL